MRWIAILGLVSCVTACGADGEPQTPTRDLTVTLTDTGLSGQARIGLSQRPVSVTLGLGL